MRPNLVVPLSWKIDCDEKVWPSDRWTYTWSKNTSRRLFARETDPLVVLTVLASTNTGMPPSIVKAGVSMRLSSCTM